MTKVARTRVGIYLTAMIIALLPGFPGWGACPSPTLRDAAVDAWSSKVISALVGTDACYADKSALTNSDCNIFVGRILEHVYGVTDFVLPVPKGGLRYMTSNEIAAMLWTKLSDRWDAIGALTDQSALNEAQRRAEGGKPVVAVWMNEKPDSPGHIAIVGPGPLTYSGKLKVSTPVSASFFQGTPADNYVGKPLSCAFRPGLAPNVRLFSPK